MQLKQCRSAINMNPPLYWSSIRDHGRELERSTYEPMFLEVLDKHTSRLQQDHADLVAHEASLQDLEKQLRENEHVDLG